MSDTDTLSLCGDEWPLMLAKAWPSLLIHLLDQKHGESLERLQLLHVALDLRSESSRQKPGVFSQVDIKRSTSGQNNFLVIKGTLALNSHISCSVALRYFVRGQRKYFKHELSISEPATWQCYEAFTVMQVRDFFQALEQPNTFFHDADLSELNGRFKLAVPVQLLLTKMLEKALGLKLWPSSEARFSFNFLSSVFIGQDFKLGQDLSLDKFNLALYADNVPAVLLYQGA